MQPRSDGRRNTPFESVIDPSLCTACGICLGACTTANPFRQTGQTLTVGIDMPGYTLDRMRQETDQALRSLTGDHPMLIFGCERGADLAGWRGADVGVVVLPCTGMVHPAFLDYALKKGAAGVVVTGCRAGDCYYRLGNWLIEERLVGSREPHLSKRVERERIAVVWAGRGDEALLQRQIEAFRLEKLVHKAKRDE